MQVLFEENGRGIVSRDNFEWNKNDFSRQFKSTTDAAEFVQRFQELTVFDRVQQVVFVKMVMSEGLNTQPQSAPANESGPREPPEVESGGKFGNKIEDKIEIYVHLNCIVLVINHNSTVII